MKITLITVGKIKERFFEDAIAEYSKRLSRYCKLEIIQVADEKTPDGASENVERQIKEKEGKRIVRLHTGDPCLYGAIREQMDALEERQIPYEVCPGVSSFCGAAAALHAEYTLPDISQSVVITRMAGRTPVPDKESIRSFAAHQATMVIFLSTGMLGKLQEELMAGGYPADTPAAIVYKATWPEEKVLRCMVSELEKTAADAQVTKTALIVVGRILEGEYERSLLYHPEFTTEFRQGKQEEQADE